MKYRIYCETLVVKSLQDRGVACFAEFIKNRIFYPDLNLNGPNYFWCLAVKCAINISVV